MAEEIREVLNLLNEKLAGLFPYRLEMVTPGELKLLEKNARYMRAEQFQSLVENIKKDGNLSSLPLCYREKDGKLRVLSGNHRVQAGRQAGVEQIMVMVVGDEKDSDERLAIHQARGYGQLAGGWGDPSKPEALRSYSQVFGVEIQGAPGRVEKGQELVKQWLKAALLTKGASGLSFSRQCPKRLFQEMQGYREHVPGTGPRHSLDALRYFFVGWLGA